MKRIRLVPDGTNIDFMKARFICFALGIVVILGSFVLFATKGLNYGIDFTGGAEIQVALPADWDTAKLRDALGKGGLDGLQLVG